jgi:mono/diheme cytochrome c family protein
VVVYQGGIREIRGPAEAGTCMESAGPYMTESMARMRALVGMALVSLVALPVLGARGSAKPAVQEKPAKTDAVELYKTNCLACHGPDGDSPLEPLSFIDDTWKHGSRLQDIVKVVTEGVDSTPMLPFKEKLTKEEILAVAKLVRSFDKSLAAKKPAAKKPVKN